MYVCACVCACSVHSACWLLAMAPSCSSSMEKWPKGGKLNGASSKQAAEQLKGHSTQQQHHVPDTIHACVLNPLQLISVCKQASKMPWRPLLLDHNKHDRACARASAKERTKHCSSLQNCKMMEILDSIAKAARERARPLRECMLTNVKLYYSTGQ